MKAADVLETHKRNHIVEQLHKLKYFDTDGKSYEELKRKLAILRAMEIDVGTDANKWF
ncbi:hypothetical protein HNQ94_000428 [Salirhabdus euzebyi]|uniref:Fur-regulated basic protein FbpA n=1 Tax=Salirhabdus euzebyi TaxID=394506 RepID=A0A841PSR2_9BACI|nr:hypothetical protein [Salirhabdus euzebyi]MBB6452007.1 hypothetical protein [Salirhabdus euzebyi]